jgi:CspA family cold shock protein
MDRHSGMPVRRLDPVAVMSGSAGRSGRFPTRDRGGVFEPRGGHNRMEGCGHREGYDPRGLYLHAAKIAAAVSMSRTGRCARPGRLETFCGVVRSVRVWRGRRARGAPLSGKPCERFVVVAPHPPRLAAPPTGVPLMAPGTVKSFSDDEGYGVITPGDGGKDLFVYHTAIAGSGFKSLTEGAKGEYEKEQAPRARTPSTCASSEPPESGADGSPSAGPSWPNADASAVACHSRDEVDRDAGMASDGVSTRAIDRDAEPLKGGRAGVNCSGITRPRRARPGAASARGRAGRRR